MIKKILKILYIAFGLLLALLVYMVGYQSNLSSHILNMTADAIDSGVYSNIALIHGGCFDKENIVNDNTDQLEIGIYPAAHLTALSYYENEESETVITKRFYENAYNIYVVAPKFSIKSYSENGKMVNNSGINLVNGDKSYKYNFVVSDTLNTDKANTKPVSTNDAYFGMRNKLTEYETWGFMNIVITQGMLEAAGINSITKLEFVNDVNEVVATLDVKLDFSQKFFNDVNPLVVKYNEYIKAIEANPDDNDKKKEAEKTFNEFYEGENGFHKSFLAIDDSYSYRYDDKVLEPGKLVWQTIGMLALYVVAAVALYLLFFHFNDLKNLFNRKKDNYRVNPASVNGVKQNAINAQAKVVEDKKPQKEEKPVVSKKVEEEAKAEDKPAALVEDVKAEEVSVEQENVAEETEADKVQEEITE